MEQRQNFKINPKSKLEEKLDGRSAYYEDTLDLYASETELTSCFWCQLWIQEEYLGMNSFSKPYRLFAFQILKMRSIAMLLIEIQVSHRVETLFLAYQKSKPEKS